MCFPGGSVGKNSGSIPGLGRPLGSVGKNSGSIPGLGRPLGEVETHSTTLAWKIPWTEEHGPRGHIESDMT